jgi:hypothetical protein
VAVVTAATAFGQAKKGAQGLWVGEMGVRETVSEIMHREWSTYPGELGKIIRNMEAPPVRPERDPPDRRNLPSAPGAPRVSSWPPARHNIASSMFGGTLRGRNPQPYAVGDSFNGATLSFAIPPDSMGDVSPTQVMVVVNDRIRVLSKTGSIGPLDADIDNFFNSVRAGSFITDPRVKFDRLTNKWYVSCVNTTSPNRFLLAVSSGPVITGPASFTFFFFQQDVVNPPGNFGQFLDYPTLGIDKDAIYVGGNMFGGGFQGCSAWVINKASVQGAGPISATAFRGIVPPAGTSGPYTPQGVDNDDPTSTEGYFIGVDAAVFSRLVIRRISNPGGVPTISGNILLNVPVTTFPMTVPALGSAAPLDGIEDRLFVAKIFHNKLTGTWTLWTAHNIEVDAAGNANPAGNRNGSRWYQIGSLTGVPALLQAGTVFSNAAANASSFWIPSMAMSLQGHSILGCSNAGPLQRAEIAMAARFGSDALGTTQPPVVIQTSASNYNVQGGTQRWGDYSNTVVDPSDGMTVWTFQEYCHANNSWAVRCIELLAPPPATIASVSQPNLARGTNPTVNVTGTVVSGSGFFDPGAGYPNHIAASVSGTGVTVNSVTFNSPTSVTLAMTVSPSAPLGPRNLTIINPDGQQTTMNNAFTVVPPPTQTINPSDYTVLVGSESSHNLAAFLLSDDVRHTVQSNSTLGFISRLDFEGTSPVLTVVRISFILESATNHSGRRRMVSLFNHNTAAWELLSTTAIPLSDGTVQVDVTTNPNRFIHPTTGQVLARVDTDFPTASRTMSRAFEFFDRAVWEIQQ